MSHWVKKETEVLNDVRKDILTLALKDMGKAYNESIKEIKNPWGHEFVDACLLDSGVTTNLGFNFVEKEGETEKFKLELVGDFYGTGINENKFMQQLSKNYQKHNVLNALENQSWNLDEMTTNAKGEIVIEASQWA